MVAQSSAIAMATANHRRALCDVLIGEGHPVERLDLPPLTVDHRALANIASYRLLGAATLADILICLDAVASTIPHPRKFLWLLDDSYLDPGRVSAKGNNHRDLTFLANVLRSAIDEAEAIFSPSRFGIERFCYLGLGKATLFAPPITPAPVRYARNAGTELLVLASLADRQRPGLLFAAIALRPEPLRVRWVAPNAEDGWLMPGRYLAADHKLDLRMAFDVRTR